MHLWAPVDGGALDAFREPEHRGQRRQPQPAHILAQEQRAFHIHDHGLATLHDEAVGAGDAGAIQQGIDRDGIAVALRRFEPEMGEGREFLGLAGFGHVDGNAARGQPVLVQVADGAEIRCPEEGNPVVLAPVACLLVAEAAFLEAEAGKAAARRQLVRGAVGRHVEVGVVVDDLAGLGGAALGALDHVHAHRRAEVRAEVKEGNRELPGATGKERVVGAEADLAVGGDGGGA